MPDDVVTTRRPPGGAGPVATSDAGQRVVVVLRPAAVLAADPASRNALVALTARPYVKLREVAERGVPVVVGGAINERVAHERSSELGRRYGLPVEVLDAGGMVRIGMGASLGVLGVAGLTGLAGALALGAPAAVSVGLLVAAGALLAGAFSALRSAGRQAAFDREARRAAATLDTAPTWNSEAWAELVALRRLTMDTDLPAMALADLWLALEEAEARLVAGRDAVEVRRDLALARDMLLDPVQHAADEASSRLRRAAAATRRTLEELDPEARSLRARVTRSQSERS